MAWLFRESCNVIFNTIPLSGNSTQQASRQNKVFPQQLPGWWCRIVENNELQREISRKLNILLEFGFITLKSLEDSKFSIPVTTDSWAGKFPIILQNTHLAKLSLSFPHRISHVFLFRDDKLLPGQHRCRRFSHLHRKWFKEKCLDFSAHFQIVFLDCWTSPALWRIRSTTDFRRFLEVFEVGVIWLFAVAGADARVIDPAGLCRKSSSVEWEQCEMMEHVWIWGVDNNA